MSDLGRLIAQASVSLIVLGGLILIIAVAVRWVFGPRLRQRQADALAAREDAEAPKLRAEVKQLRERLAVLERITVEKESSLEREFAQLRDG